jgi:hypothetical protein
MFLPIGPRLGHLLSPICDFLRQLSERARHVLHNSIGHFLQLSLLVDGLLQARNLERNIIIYGRFPFLEYGLTLRRDRVLEAPGRDLPPDSQRRAVR